MTPAPVPHGPDPKIELHVHLEGTVRPRELMDVATRNGVGLPADTVEELEQLYVFRDFEHFIELWIMTTHAIRTEADFREIVVAYTHEAATPVPCTSRASSRRPSASWAACRGTRCSLASATGSSRRTRRARASSCD